MLETAFKRNVQNPYFQGTAADNLAQVEHFSDTSAYKLGSDFLVDQKGDVVTLFGRESPIFDFGDISIMQTLQMTVRSKQNSPKLRI